MIGRYKTDRQSWHVIIEFHTGSEITHKFRNQIEVQMWTVSPSLRFLHCHSSIYIVTAIYI